MFVRSLATSLPCLRALRSQFHPTSTYFAPQEPLSQSIVFSGLTARRVVQSRSFLSTRRFQAGRGGGYQRFENRSSQRDSPVILLLRRWIERPTFYYEVGGLSGVAGGVYVYNLEEVPISGRRRFNVYGPEYEKSLSEDQYRLVMREYSNQLLSDRDPRSQLVRKVLERLIPASGLDPEGWVVHVIESDEPNAFVIPGGKVFVFTGILPICAGELGVATVLGHEIAHNLAHHIAEKMSQGWLLQAGFLVIKVACALSGFELPDSMTGTLLSLGFERPGSRSQESEADYIGLMIMADACYNPQEAPVFWGRMQQAEKSRGGAPPQFLSTHPSSSNRQAKLQEWLPKALDKYNSGECRGIGGYVTDFRNSVQGSARP